VIQVHDRRNPMVTARQVARPSCRKRATICRRCVLP